MVIPSTYTRFFSKNPIIVKRQKDILPDRLISEYVTTALSGSLGAQKSSRKSAAFLHIIMRIVIRA
jgi:hypothetical protein